MAIALTAKNKMLQAQGVVKTDFEACFRTFLRSCNIASADGKYLCELQFDLLRPISIETLPGANHTQDPANLKRGFLLSCPPSRHFSFHGHFRRRWRGAVS